MKKGAAQKPSRTRTITRSYHVSRPNMSNIGQVGMTRGTTPVFVALTRAQVHEDGRLAMFWRRQVSGQKELTPVQARQGFLDRPVLVVLIASTFLVCVAFGIAWLTT
jgi:hypothetical protein